MYTEEILLRQLKSLGIRETDTLIVHTALKAVGPLDTTEKTGAEVLISALRKAVPKGLLLIPSFTFANIRETPVFDIRHTEPCVGVVPRVAAKLANEAYDRGDKTCVRSFHVSHSVVAFGERAAEYIKADRDINTPTPMHGSIGKLYEENAKILLIGLDLVKATFIHAVDEALEPKGISAPYPVTAIDYDGRQYPREGRNTQGPTANYPIYEPYFQRHGVIAYGKLGDAQVRILNARRCFETVKAYRETAFKCKI
jgi:aminoglycoside 3-N-acetyltransferase